MNQQTAVEKCADCFLCKFTRNRKKNDFFYHIARRVQGTCPICTEANKATGKDMQKSTFII